MTSSSRTPKPSTAKRAKAPLLDRAKVPTERPGQPGGRRDTNRKERTKALADAALKLFLERGIEAVTIEDITTQAGVAKGSFYRYFDDKQALVESLFAPIATAVNEAFIESLEKLRAAKSKEEAFDSYQVLGAGLANILLHHTDVVQLYIQEARGPLEGARGPARRLAQLISERAIEHTEAAHKHGLLKPVKPEISTLAVIGAAERMIWATLAGENLGGVEPWEVPGQLITILLDGVRATD